jgi:hypothetical protein
VSAFQQNQYALAIAKRPRWCHNSRAASETPFSRRTTMLRMTCLLTLSLGVIAGASAATGPGYRLGVYEVQSQLGQPLRLAIDVLPEPGAPPTTDSRRAFT